MDRVAERERSPSRPACRYRLGGNRVLRKWLPYRNSGIPARGLRRAEARHHHETGPAAGGEPPARPISITAAGWPFVTTIR